MDRQQERTLGAKILAAIVLLLLLVIGFLLWLLFRPQPEAEKIPTGNVDVFDINISCLCVKENGEECDNKDEEEKTPGNDGYNNYSSSTINKRDDTTVDDDGIVYVDDADGWYVYQKNLNIFKNAAFQYTNKIAPGSSNSYDFKVHNSTKNTIRYSIDFEEESEYAVNLQYRLKRGGQYIVGDDDNWVNANTLAAAMTQLSKDGVDSYTLDWRWPYEDGTDEADSEAGKNMSSGYSLGIKINFEEV